MRALAETLMKGRSQAVMVVVIAAMLPLLYWVSAAGVGLITLRKGVTEGTRILVWALLPALMWLLSGDPAALLVIFGSYVLAAVLRSGADWRQVLIVLLPLGVVSSYVLELALGGLLDQIVNAATQMISARQNGNPAMQAMSEMQIRNLIIGAIGAFHSAVTLGCVMLARSWQARLYNPGGFQQEFHQLRLPLAYAATLLLALLFGDLLGVAMGRWYALLLLPLVIAGLALVHGLVAKRGLGKGWLMGLYLSLLFFAPYLITLLVILALIDAVLDLRARTPAGN